jgi:MFS family permease
MSDVARNFARRLFGLDYADDMPLSPEKRRGLSYLYYNAVFALFADAAVANYTNVFLVALRATNTEIGLLATLTQVATAIAPVPGAALAERTGAYKASVIWPNLIGRLGFVALALLPLLSFGQAAGNQIAIGLAIAIFAARAFLASWSVAPWTAFVGRLVPMNIRANYFAARNFIGGIATIVGALLAGQVITSFGYPLGFQVVFIVSALVGIGATVTFARIPFQEEKPNLRLRGPSKSSLQSRARATLTRLGDMMTVRTTFGRFLISSCALAFAVNIGGPFIQVYQVKVLGFTAALIGVLVSFELGVNIVMQRVYGSFVISRFGDFRVMRALRFLTCLIPLAWIFVTSPLAAAVVGVMAGLIWSGHELANFNCLLEITPENRRANYIAVHTFAVSIFAALGPAIGGVLTDAIGYQALFALSAALRVLAAVLLVVLVKKV